MCRLERNSYGNCWDVGSYRSERDYWYMYGKYQVCCIMFQKLIKEEKCMLSYDVWYM
jgi:hypothetical protein